MPACVNNAPRVMVRVAAATVCEAAARRPASVRPASTVRTGILRVTRRATREGARAAEGLQGQQGETGTAVALPPLEHVVAADVVLVAEGGEGGGTDAEPGQPDEQGDADAAGLHGDARDAWARMGGGERGVQTQVRVGVGDAQAVGADEPHAVRAADGQQGPCLVGVQARSDDEESGYARFAALLGDLRDRRGRYGEDCEVRGLGRRADRRVRRHTENRARGRVHREQAPGVAARVQLVQDRPTHRARLAPRSDDGDRLRPQQRLRLATSAARARSSTAVR